MRLWHKDLIAKLPDHQILGQNRECAALRGLGWGKPHSTVNYVFNHPYSVLYWYHLLIMKEMKRRGFKPSLEWFDASYRGKRIQWDYSEFTDIKSFQFYPEHDKEYLDECIQNLKEKGIEING